MKHNLLLLAATAALLLSCTSTPRPEVPADEDPVIEKPLPSSDPAPEEPAPGENPSPDPKSPYPETGPAETVTISFVIVESFPYYHALADVPVPCDVYVYDRHDHIYPIAGGANCSEDQHEPFEEGKSPEKRECDVAKITAVATGEASYTDNNGVLYLFRIGSYDE